MSYDDQSMMMVPLDMETAPSGGPDVTPTHRKTLSWVDEVGVPSTSPGGDTPPQPASTYTPPPLHLGSLDMGSSTFVPKNIRKSIRYRPSGMATSPRNDESGELTESPSLSAVGSGGSVGRNRNESFVISHASQLLTRSNTGFRAYALQSHQERQVASRERRRKQEEMSPAAKEQKRREAEEAKMKRRKERLEKKKAEWRAQREQERFAAQFHYVNYAPPAAIAKLNPGEGAPGGTSNADDEDMPDDDEFDVSSSDDGFTSAAGFDEGDEFDEFEGDDVTDYDGAWKGGHRLIALPSMLQEDGELNPDLGGVPSGGQSSAAFLASSGSGASGGSNEEWMTSPSAKSPAPTKFRRVASDHFLKVAAMRQQRSHSSSPAGPPLDQEELLRTDTAASSQQPGTTNFIRQGSMKVVRVRAKRTGYEKEDEELLLRRQQEVLFQSQWRDFHIQEKSSRQLLIRCAFLEQRELSVQQRWWCQSRPMLVLAIQAKIVLLISSQELWWRRRWMQDEDNEMRVFLQERAQRLQLMVDHRRLFRQYALHVSEQLAFMDEMEWHRAFVACQRQELRNRRMIQYDQQLMTLWHGYSVGTFLFEAFLYGERAASGSVRLGTSGEDSRGRVEELEDDHADAGDRREQTKVPSGDSGDSIKKVDETKPSLDPATEAFNTDWCPGTGLWGAYTDMMREMQTLKNTVEAVYWLQRNSLEEKVKTLEVEEGHLFQVYEAFFVGMTFTLDRIVGLQGVGASEGNSTPPSEASLIASASLSSSASPVLSPDKQAKSRLAQRQQDRRWRQSVAGKEGLHGLYAFEYLQILHRWCTVYKTILDAQLQSLVLIQRCGRRRLIVNQELIPSIPDIYKRRSGWLFHRIVRAYFIRQYMFDLLSTKRLRNRWSHLNSNSGGGTAGGGASSPSGSPTRAVMAARASAAAVVPPPPPTEESSSTELPPPTGVRMTSDLD